MDSILCCNWVSEVQVWAAVLFWGISPPVCEGVLYVPTLTRAALDPEAVVTVVAHPDLQTTLCFSVLDLSSLRIKHICLLIFFTLTLCRFWCDVTHSPVWSPTACGASSAGPVCSRTVRERSQSRCPPDNGYCCTCGIWFHRRSAVHRRGNNSATQHTESNYPQRVSISTEREYWE